MNPSAGNLGGGGFMFITMPMKIKRSHLTIEKERLKLPTEEMFLDKDGEVIKNLSLNSYLAAGDTWNGKGMFKIHDLFGSKSMNDLISPSVKIAKERL